MLPNQNNPPPGNDFRGQAPFGGVMSGMGNTYAPDFVGFDQQSALNFARFQREEEFKIQNEDFPALGAAPKAGAGNS